MLVLTKNYFSHNQTHEESKENGVLYEFPRNESELVRVIYAGKGEDKTCNICITPYKENETLIYLPCLHTFHESCILPWLRDNENCPNCKKEVYLKSC